MPRTVEHTWDNKGTIIAYGIISSDRIVGVSSINEEFLKNARKSIHQFYNSSAMAREALVQGVLKSTLTRLDSLLIKGADKNDYGLPIPKQAVVSYAKEWIVRLFLESQSMGLDWIEPHVTTNFDGEVVFEWWYGAKKLTVYIEDRSAEYVQVWRKDVDSAISDGYAETINACRSLWIWLVS